MGQTTAEEFIETHILPEYRPIATAIRQQRSL